MIAFMHSLRVTPIAILCLVAATTNANAVEPIVVIAPFNLTGQASALDIDAYDGATLAADLINNSGGIDGRTMELIPVDTESNADVIEATVGAALATHPGAIAGIGYTYSREALVAGKLFQTAGLPFISPGATDPSVPAEVGNNLFYAAYGDNAQAATMAAFVHQELKLDRAAVWIDTSRIYTKTVGRFFQDSFKQSGGSVDLVVADDDANGYSDFLTRFQTTTPAPQVIYAASLPISGATIIEQTRTAGISVPTLSADGWDEDSIVTASESKGLRGIYFTTHMFVGVDTLAMQAFNEAYETRYGKAATSAFAPLGYDSVNLLRDAIQRAGSTDPGAIRDALAATTDFEGVVGKIAYRPGDRVPLKAVSVVAVDNGVESLRWVFQPQ